MGRPHKCPFCGEAGKSVSKGVRRTKTMGDRRIRLCKACGRKFTPRNQRPAEPRVPEAKKPVEPGPEPEEISRAQTQAGVPEEAAQALRTMLPPPDQQWTS